MNIRDDLLPLCTVRVDYRDNPSGTGFFVAPGRVVTCAHVIQPEGPKATIIPTDISIRDHEGNVSVVEEVPEVWSDKNLDLAILKVATGTAHACVLLDSAIGAGDELHSYGYPIDPDTGELQDEGGVPTTFETEGRQGNGWIKFKEGQTVPGMSGSPVLSLSTGCVCGIVKRTRGMSQALGGLAVPVSALLQHASWLSSANEAVHAADNAWVELLTTEQRQIWRVADGPKVTTARAIQMVITVSQDDRTWWVGARLHPENRPIDRVEVSLDTVRPAVARLFRAWAIRGRITEDEQVRKLGEVLFRAAFPDTIQDALTNLVDDADARVVVSLRFEKNVDEDLVNLPWEHLYQPDQGVHSGMTLATDPRLGFVRTLGDAPDAKAEEPSREAFSVLVVAVTPELRLSDDPDVSNTVRLLEALGDELRVIDVEVITNPSAMDLLEELRKPYDVLHYVGYGKFEGEDLLALGGARRGEALGHVTVDVLRRCLPQDPPQLVVLQPCENDAASGAVPADFAMLGSPLVRQIAAALIFQYPLPGKVAESFNDAFYRGLVDGKPLDMAVQEGRLALSLAHDQPRAHASPALFQRDPGERRLVRGTPSTNRLSLRSEKLTPRLPRYR